ncbi:hypothetical protein J437_LFUL015820 [Ladona fulva]|uniref:Coiled-coil domain-containing protein n=1 Tax=Ladona fulva TaxID=123851 RepID=A0A8K0KKZ9_LADFU|nr:hypothetical protein J437_LFUL015820 [Ladona fulva]
MNKIRNSSGNESSTSTINAQLDLTESSGEGSRKISVKSTMLSDVKAKTNYSVNNVTRILYSMSIIDDQKSNALNKSEEIKSFLNKTNHHSVSSSRITSLETDSIREKSGDANFNYSSDFNSNNSTKTKKEMTAWEKWFLMKQEEIRRRKEIERKREREKEKERRYQEMLRQKKRKESEACVKQWLERKKIEIQNRQEMGEAKEERINQGSHAFEHWVLRKYQQKKVEHLRGEYMKKKEVEEKKKKAKESEEAVKRWMARAKQRPQRLSYACRGGSKVCYYDATHPPSPTFINPLPWQD